MYSVKEIFYTLQGEGANSGRPAVFCRFSGCNLWSGREVHRTEAICQFCDTDFVGTDGINGGRFGTAESLARRLDELWGPESDLGKFVVFTGGEPLLQLDRKLVSVAKQFGFTVAVETNGTIRVPNGIDWVCVSPKEGTQLQVRKGNEIKLVFPQANAHPSLFEDLDFEHFFVQPMDGDNLEENLKASVEFCKSNPKWRLSTQIHKAIGIP